MEDPANRRLNGRRIAPDFLRVVQFVERLIVQADREQRADERRVGRHQRRRDLAVVGWTRHVGDQLPLRRAAVQAHDGKASVVAVQVVGGDQRVARVGRRLVVERLVRATRPVQPRRPVVGAREVRRRRFERGDRVGIATGAERPPPDLPGRALGVMPGRVLLIELAERRLGLLVVALENVVRRQVVQRFFSPALVGELGDDAAHRSDVLGVIAELARRDRVEEERFAATRAFLGVGTHAVARAARALHEVVALGQAQVDQLAIVARGGPAQTVEDRTRQRVALRAEVALAAADLELVARAAGGDRCNRQMVELRGGGLCRIAERQLVDDARVGFSGFVEVADGFGGPAHAHQHVVGRGGLGLRQPLVDRQRGALIAERLVRFRLAERCAFDEKADRRLRLQPLEGALGVRRTSDLQLREPLVVDRVVAERSLLLRRLRDDRQRLREVRVDLELHGAREVLHRGGAGDARVGGGRREPVLRWIRGKTLMIRRLERGRPRRRGALLRAGHHRREERGGERDDEESRLFHVSCSRVASPLASVRTSSSKK